MFRTIYLTILILVLLQSSSPLNVPKEDPLAYELQTIDDALHWLSHDFTVKLLVLYDDRDVSSRTLRAAWPGILEVIAPILCAPAVVNLQSSIGKFLATTMSTEGVRVPTVRIYPAERVPRRHVPPTLNRLSGVLKPSIEYTGGLSASGLRSAVVATYTDKHIVYTTSLIGLWEHLQSVSADLKDGTPPLYYLVLASNKNTSTDLFRVVSTRIRHAVRCIQVVITDKSTRSSNKTANKKRAQESLEVAEGVLLHVFGASKLPLLNFFQLSTPLPEINWNQTEISVETLAAAFDHIPATSFTSQKSKISIETLLDFVLRNLPQGMDPVDGDSPDHRETEKRTVHSNTELGQRVQQFELTAITSRSRQTEKYLRHVAGQMQNGALYLPSQSLLYSWANNLFNEDVMGVAFLDPTTDEHSSILSTLSQLTREANRLSVQQVSRATHSVRRTADSSAGTRFRVRSYFWISTIGHVQLMNFFGGIESNSLVFIFPQKERFTLYAGALTMKDIISFLERIVANGLRSKEFSMGGLGEVCGREV